MEAELIVSSNEVVQVYRMLPDGTTDAMVIEMWLHGLSKNTQLAYARDIKAFLHFFGKALSQMKLNDLQDFSDSLVDLKKSSRVRAMNAIKSLFTFCHKTGYLPVNIGAAVRVKKVSSKIAGHILTEEQVLTMFIREEDPVKHTMLRTLYYGGLRVSELCSLVWADIVPNAFTGGQINVVDGKGEKSRQIPIPQSLYQELVGIRHETGSDEPVFQTRTGKAVDRVQVFHVVKVAALRAKLPGETSPHWLRHAHGSHALNHGAPIQLVRDTMGHSNIAVTNQYSHARPNASSATYLPV